MPVYTTAYKEERMERYVGQIQSWSSHLGHRTERGAIYDTSRRRGRGNTGTLGRDFGFVEFTDPERIEGRLAELNQKPQSVRRDTLRL